MSAERVVWYDPARPAEEQPAFPRGEAGFVVIHPGGDWETSTEVEIGPNSHCALVHHGVAAQLEALPAVEGSVGRGLDALVPPAATEDVARIFYEADRKTYGATFEFVAAREAGVEYRVAIDNREYQKTLSKLQFLATTAARHGHGLRIRL